MFVILGASGKVGRSTIQTLRAQGAPVRALVRESSNSADLVALGCEVGIADLRDAAAMKKAMDGAKAVQVICPPGPQSKDAAGEMAEIIDAITGALAEVRPDTVLAISDYGAEVSQGTGITMAFHDLEAQLHRLPSSVTFVRSAEHMQNWSRFIQSAAETGVLPSLHQPVTKIFPTVSAPDVGTIAGELLLVSSTAPTPRIVHVEGPRRYTVLDVAAILSEIVGREIVPRAIPQSDWIPAFMRGGLSLSYANLLSEMYVAHNAGRIDVEPGVGEVRFGKTDLSEVFGQLLARPAV